MAEPYQTQPHSNSKFHPGAIGLTYIKANTNAGDLLGTRPSRGSEYVRAWWSMVGYRGWGQNEDFGKAISNTTSYMPVSSICRRGITHASVQPELGWGL